ncbi:hypothetical protein Ddye_027939 [Dipteronia dyeriana]|uniref:Uncharacterized protein n=1 Tax=Dipteronia dyeriana TaxID=168575 RepID=A0AAD9TR02_9ROSI|nr:hypothetical protein Ddye_027939 [Dipteronia dyeriana]
MSFQSILLSSFLVLLFVAHVKSSTFNVKDKGAHGDSKSNDTEGNSGVAINDVHFSNIRRTTNTKIAVKLNCSQSNPCQKIEMRDLNMAYNGGGGPAKSACANAHGFANGQQQPPSCLVA